MGTFNCFCSSLHLDCNLFSRRIFSFVLHCNIAHHKKGSFLNPGFDLVMVGKNRHPIIGTFSVNIAILILQVKSCVQINTVFLEFSITLLQAKKESLFIIPAENEVEWVLLGTVIASTLSTNSSQPKNSPVFYQIVDDVIPIIFKVYECFLLLQWEILSAEPSYKCTIY